MPCLKVTPFSIVETVEEQHRFFVKYSNGWMLQPSLNVYVPTKALDLFSRQQY